MGPRSFHQIATIISAFDTSTATESSTGPRPWPCRRQHGEATLRMKCINKFALNTVVTMMPVWTRMP
jgi:hypothetical protein